MEHIKQSTNDMLNSMFERSVRRLDTQLERGEITKTQHAVQLRHMVEAVS